jgi:hypothetical protein
MIVAELEYHTILDYAEEHAVSFDEASAILYDSRTVNFGLWPEEFLQEVGTPKRVGVA